MEQAKFYSEIADGPSQGAAYWVHTNDNVRLRVGTYGADKDRKGTILLFLGRFGYIERYGRVAKDFDKNGFSTVVIDWRSQGLSDRMADDRHTGHVHRFSDYQKDVAAMVKAAEELELPKPWYLVGISMGACIGLRAMLEGLPVAATAFISPMFGIKMSPLQRIAAWPLSWAAQKIGKGHIYVPGESGEIYMLTTPFEKNNLTRNPVMYQYWVDQARAVPDLQIGGPSMAWLYQGLSECRNLSKMRSPDIPCITFCGELDELVDIVAQYSTEQNGEDVNSTGICPAALGTKDQQPAAYSPKTELMYVPTNHVCMDYEPFRVSYTAGQPYVGATLAMYPAQDSHGGMGNFIAWDNIKGEIKWSVPEKFSVWSGALATAGDIVFYGTLEGHLKAVHAETGEELYRFKTPSGIIGNVMTYVHDGQQYIGILSGVGGWAGIGLAAGLTNPNDGLGAVGGYAALSDYTALGGQLTVFKLPN